MLYSFISHSNFFFMLNCLIFPCKLVKRLSLQLSDLLIFSLSLQDCNWRWSVKFAGWFSADPAASFCMKCWHSPLLSRISATWTYFQSLCSLNCCSCNAALMIYLFVFLIFCISLMEVQELIKIFVNCLWDSVTDVDAWPKKCWKTPTACNWLPTLPSSFLCHPGIWWKQTV